MENEITTKRGFILILVVATVAVFIGLVWLIATFVPWNLLGFPSPSITATAVRVEKNCTYPISYWMEHPESFPPQMVIGGMVYDAKDLREILADETQNLAPQIQAQLVGVFLNTLAGAEQSSIETTIFEAYGWLVKHPEGSQVSDGDREAGVRLFKVLEAYNDGLAEVALCEGVQIPTLITSSTPTETPTVLLTLAPSETTTPTPSETPTPTELTGTPTYFFIVPTRTTKPTTEPPPQVPTNTPVAPTETKIPPPPDTPTFAPPPTPTEAPIITQVPTQAPTEAPH
jgi:hypothetical protein